MAGEYNRGMDSELEAVLRMLDDAAEDAKSIRIGDKPAAPASLILDKAETIEFTTDEGTWMSLDVSPDGKTIAFLSDRSSVENLWIANADGSRSTICG